MSAQPAPGASPAGDRVPEQTIHRLPIYLRCLTQARTIGVQVINSLQIAQMAGTNAAQVRKDLSYLGELGTRGIGYDVEALAAHISDELGLSRRRPVAIVGLGRLGCALLNYRGFSERGFDVVAVFDSDPNKIGADLGWREGLPPGFTVEGADDMEAVLADREVEMVLLAVPVEAAQEMAERVCAAGVRSILNFTSAMLELPADVHVRTVDLSLELQVLSFHLSRSE